MVSRHGVETIAIYGIAFVALALMDFTVWERLGFAALSALVFGSLWIANSPVSSGLPGVSPMRRAASNVGYWCLSVSDWLGYFGVLCFGTAILVEMV
ncbi:MAG TPA: hypothetical protein VFI17_12360 [Solirubrobacterales bacterium]|nr:hypothetical protein [Solirubrobacterales bacterium]